MMMVPAVVSEVENIKYVTHQPEGADFAANALRIDLANGNSVHVPNGDFTADNPALCVMAFLGARPSDMEAAEGEALPYVLGPEGNYGVPGYVVAQGRRALEDADWFSPQPQAAENGAVEMPGGGVPMGPAS
jgi:hypothetical protein